MAETILLSNNNLTRKRWASSLHQLILKDVEINDLLGKGTNAIIEMRTELGKGKGDTITFGVRKPLSGEGRVGRETVEGSEESLSFADFSVTIEELNHAVHTGGRMEQQRVPYNLMQEAKNGLQYWWAEKLSDMAFAHLCGDDDYRINPSTPVFAQAPTLPDANHWIMCGQEGTAASKANELNGSTTTMTVRALDKMIQLADTPNSKDASNPNGVANLYKIRPIMINGKPYYRVILHPYCFQDLRSNFDVGEWGDMLRAANMLKEYPKAEVVYGKAIITRSERIRKRTDGTNTIYRNILLGAQAAVWAWGGAGESKSSTMSFVPYETDANRYVNVRGGGIFGMKKTEFDDIDYGIVVCAAAGAAISDY